MPTRDVPFFPNTADATHCFQASFKMILKYFWPERDFSWQELEEMSAKVPGLATWPQAMLVRLREMGFGVQLVESFDAPSFIKEGGMYLQRAFGKQTADWQIANSDIPQEQRLYQQLLDAGVPAEAHRRVPRQAFEAAWADPNAQAKSLIAVRRLKV